MNQLPQNEVEVTNGKNKFRYKTEGVGVSIFTTLLIILGIFCAFVILAILWVSQSTGAMIVALIIAGLYFWIFYKIFNRLNEMAHDEKTQHLFYTPNQMLPAYKYLHPQFSDDSHKAKEITDKTKYTQPQFPITDIEEVREAS